MPTRSRKPRPSRTRADVADSFKELQNRDTETLDPQAASLATEHAKKVRAAVSILSVDDIAQKNTALSLEVNRTFADLTEKCIGKATELKTLEEAVKLESTELERLYGVDIASASIQILIQEHTEKKEALEKEIALVRAQWAEERTNHTKENQLRDVELRDSRRREEESYSYSLKVSRAKAADEFEQTKLLKERELAEKIDVAVKDIVARREALVADEKAAEVLKVRVAGIDEEIKKAVGSAVGVATNSLKRELEHGFALEKKDLESKLAIEARNNAALSDANGKLAEQILSMQKQLDASREQMQAVSLKAFESVSGQLALSKVQETLKDNGAAKSNKS